MWYTIIMKRNEIYFISDAHLGFSPSLDKEGGSVLLKFLEEISDRAEKLFIVGDLFDFWVEYKWAIRPDYFDILCGLKKLHEKGVEIHYCLGNHDFALGGFLKNRIGIRIHRENWRGELQGVKTMVIHGDGLRKGDRANRFLRRILRNRFLQRLYRILHPGLGVPLAEFFSRLSRRHFPPRRMKEILEEYRLIARDFLRNGTRIVVIGHTHHPEIVNFDSGVYCNTGNWMGDYS